MLRKVCLLVKYQNEKAGSDKTRLSKSLMFTTKIRLLFSFEFFRHHRASASEFADR